MGKAPKEIFRLEYASENTNGNMEIDIEEFFLVSNKTTIKKFLKIVKKKGRVGQSTDLIRRLYSKMKSCDDILEPLADLRKQSEKLLSEYLGREEKIPLSPQEKVIVKRRNNYAYGIEFLTEGC